MNSLLIASAYFPPIEYFAYLAKAASAIIEAHETYPKQTYRNRCHIYSPSGIQALTIPISKVNGNHTKTKEIEISEHSDWRNHHWKSIKTAYNASAFFMYYETELKEAMFFNTTNLMTYNTHLLNHLLNEIGIEILLKTTDIYDKKPTDVLDLRDNINPKNKSSKFLNPEYYQVFKEKHGFIPNLSILDLLFNEGPNTLNYLQSV